MQDVPSELIQSDDEETHSLTQEHVIIRLLEDMKLLL